jgi:hypothetical protein
VDGNVVTNGNGGLGHIPVSAEDIREYAKTYLSTAMPAAEFAALLTRAAAAGVPEARDELLKILARMDAGAKQ